MAEQQMSRGALAAIFANPDAAAERYPAPVFQCLQIKTLENKGTNDRYRLVLSDLENYTQAMLATQANTVVHDGGLQIGCFVRLKSFTAQDFKGRYILIILDLEVITSLPPAGKLGQPKALDQAPAGPAQPATIGGAGFYGVKNEKPQESKPAMTSRPHAGGGGGSGGGGSGGGGGGGGNAPSTIYPIEGLSPYAHKWTIKARVTHKSDIRTWHKASGDGKLFSVNFLDETGEIRATAFNEQCDQWHAVLQEGAVYYVSGCKVQFAKKQFSNLPNDFELVFERDTLIEKADDQGSVPTLRFSFVSIHELQSVDKDATVDVIGVLREVGDVAPITSAKTQKPYDKRELTLADDSGFSVRVTVWGKLATQFDAAPEAIIAFKGTKVSDFGGRSLSLLSSGTMTVDPDIPEAHRLKGWYESAGRDSDFLTHNTMSAMGAAGAGGRAGEAKTIAQAKDENLGMDPDGKPDYFNLHASVVYIKQDTFCYPACRSPDCNKKLVDLHDGTWRCEKCDVAHDRPAYRYIMTINVCDHTGQLWLTCFEDQARQLMGGRSADELMDMREQGDEARLSTEFEAANCRKMAFRVRAKLDNYQDQTRVRYQVYSLAPIDYKAEGHRLAGLIDRMSSMGV